MFSEELDRAKFGKYTILIESVVSLSVCYLYRGQTYPAIQKLRKFIEVIKKSTSIWQSLEKHYKTSQILEPNDNPALLSLISEIFFKNS